MDFNKVKIDDFLIKLFEDKNIKLTEAQAKINNINKKKNVLILSPCGSGKTEIAYYLSKVWGGRCIYTLPMQTLATSLRERLNKYESKLHTDKSWSLQHSLISEDKFLDNDYSVTTIDQVLSGFLGFGSQSFIRGKNVVKSNFIFDEIQLLEPGKTLKTTILMLDTLSNYSNKFCIMTATMPKSLINFLCNRYDMEVIIVENDAIGNKENKIKLLDDLNIKEIESYNQKQIIICNTQREQIGIYNSIKDKSRLLVLNNKLLDTDRKNIENEVLKYFGKNSKENNKILISTQILEAGIDISASKMYSSLAPIDNIVQRCGRLCRWGGSGELAIFKGDYELIYDKDICEKTLEVITKNIDKRITWSLEKYMVDEVLDNYYLKNLSLEEMKKFRLAMRQGNSRELIRDIRSVNLIVVGDKEISKEDFKKEFISISLHSLKKLSTTNKVYTYDKGKIKATTIFKFGETYLIKGNDCIYDKLGFRIEKSKICDRFKYKINNQKDIIFFDYNEETWLAHAYAVKNIMLLKLRDNIVGFSTEEIKRISFIAGLHDLGKLTTNWQKYINGGDTLLAHNKISKRNYSLIKNTPHKFVSGLSIREYLKNDTIDEFFEFNMLIQHHGRIIQTGACETVKNYKFKKGTRIALKKYGFKEKLNLKDNNRSFTDKHIYTPLNKEWIKFVYIMGLLMESDIGAIKHVKSGNFYLS